MVSMPYQINNDRDVLIQVEVARDHR